MRFSNIIGFKKCNIRYLLFEELYTRESNIFLEFHKKILDHSLF